MLENNHPLHVPIKEYLAKRSVKKDDRIVVGVSGGSDSIALACLLSEIHPRDNLIVAHLDHGLRSESRGDRDFVESVAGQLGCVFVGQLAHITELQRKGEGLEMCARRVRYDFFERVQREYGAQWIATAHHQGDQGETVLMNILRGARIGGLCGIRADTAGLLRPLLALSKDQLQQYLRERGQNWREDASNVSRDFLRNRVRLDVMPLLEWIAPNASQELTNLAQYMSAVKEHFDHLCDPLLDNDALDVRIFAGLSDLLQWECLRRYWERVVWGTRGLSNARLYELKRFILTAEGSTEKAFSGVVFYKKNGKIGAKKLT